MHAYNMVIANILHLVFNIIIDLEELLLLLFVYMALVSMGYVFAESCRKASISGQVEIGYGSASEERHT